MELFAGVLISLFMCGALFVLYMATVSRPKVDILVLRQKNEEEVLKAAKRTGIDALLLFYEEPGSKELKKLSHHFDVQMIRKENTDGA